jgi:gluconate 2-dehydrogenase gamma chain
MSELSRRAFLTTAGGALAVAWLAADAVKLLASGAHAAGSARQNAQPSLRFLSPADAAELEAATSQIVPTDETPGAREARVVNFIDHALDTWQRDQRSTFKKGVAELRKRARAAGTKSFASLSSEQQHGVIAALEKDKHPFFNVLRGATIVAMLANPSYGGNHDKIGWKTIGFEDRFAWSPPFGWYDANEG